MSDTRGYERGEDKLVEAVAQVLFRRMPPEEARNFAVAVQRLSSDLSGNNQPASSCRRLRERVFQLIGENYEEADTKKALDSAAKEGWVSTDEGKQEPGGAISCGMCGDTGRQNGVLCPQLGCKAAQKINSRKPFEKGERVVVHGVVVNNLTRSLGVVLVDTGDIQERVMGVRPDRLDREELLGQENSAQSS